MLLGAVILACGMLIGAGLTLHLLRSNILSLLQEPERLPGIVAGRLDRALDLSETQRVEVEGILNAHLHTLDGIRRENAPRVEAEIDAIRDEVAAALTPEQAAQWRARFETLRHRWRPAFIVPEAGE